MTRFAATPLALLVLAVSACGGDDAPSKAEFAADADKICRNAEKQLADVAEGASSPKEVAAAVDKVIEQSQSSVDELQDLDRPDGAAGDAAEKFVDALGSDIEDKGIPALEDLRDAIRDNDQQAAAKATERLQAIETSNTDKLARDAGAKACAE
jgi:hypothetical protein